MLSAKVVIIRIIDGLITKMLYINQIVILNAKENFNQICRIMQQNLI